MTSPPQRRSAYSLGSLSNLLRSLLVLGLFVAVLVALVPRSDKVDRPPVDARASAGRVVAETGWPVELPAGLAAGWVSTAANLASGTDRVTAFTTVWRAPGGGDVALSQARSVTAEWVARSVNDAARSGDVRVGARIWERYAGSEGSRVSYLLRGAGATGLTLVATANTSEVVLRDFLAALQRVPPSR